MNLDKNDLFSYYHKLRMEEHIPLVPFLNLPEMKFVLVPGTNIKEISNHFNREYTRWRKSKSLPPVIVSVEQYIGWLCKRYNKDQYDLIQYWYQYQYKIKSVTPLTIAVSIFVSFYSDIQKVEICNLTGVTLLNLDNHCKKIDDIALISKKVIENF